ncbi:CurL C-terminal domain-containing protein, partial [Streptomyces cyaneofuscatus]
MRHRRIPPSPRFEKPNAAIDLDTSPFYVSTRGRRWESPPDGGPRRGAVSSFGASGTNAHLVIEEAPAPTPTRARRPDLPRLVVLSAHSREQLAQQAARLAARVRQEEGLDLADLAYTLMAGRDRFPHRFACVAKDRTALLRILEGGLDAPEAYTGLAEPAGKGRPDPDAGRGEACLQRCVRTTLAENPPSDAATFLADLTVLAECFVRDIALDYGALFPVGAHRRISLPTYPFARESHWAGPPPAEPQPVPTTPGKRPAAGHPLIHRTSPVPESPGALRAAAVLTDAEPVLRDHTVRGQHVLPGVVHLELARETAVRLWDADASAPLLMRDVTWVRPATADAGGRMDVHVLVKPGLTAWAGRFRRRPHRPNH